jgi:hypothetical protein
MFAMALIAIGVVTLAGCAKEGPLGPEELSTGDHSGAAKMMASTMCMTTEMVGPSPVSVIVLPSSSQPAADTLYASAVIRPDTTGVIRLSWKNVGYDGRTLSSVKMSLRFPVGTVDAPTLITIAVRPNRGIIDATFGPSGLVFKKPAQLSVSATGLDLSNYRYNSTCDCWYVDEMGTTWIQSMQAGKIKLSVSQGTLEVTGIEIPHFSRYAFGR